MDKIKKFLSTNIKYTRLAKPLEAAAVCEVARAVGEGRFSVLSFRDGLLTVGTQNSGAAANLQMESDSIVKEINAKLDHELVKKIRFKIV